MNAIAAPKPLDCRAENAKQFLTWIRERGGLALWRTLNLSNPGQSWTCPLKDAEGNIKGKPHGYADSEPCRIITNTDDVIVHVDKEVKRFHVGLIQRGMKIVLTDGATRRVNAAVEKAGEGAYHVFDGQDAVIMAPEPGKSMTLTEWAKINNA